MTCVAPPEEERWRSGWVLVVVLSDGDGEDGGMCEGEKVVHAMSPGDAVLFHSEKTHNVAPVTHGVRHSLVLELWSGAENIHDRSR